MQSLLITNKNIVLSILAIVIVVCCNSDVTLATKRLPPLTITDDNWAALLKGEWLVDFYAPWCPACSSLKPEWEKLAEWSNELNIKVASVDVTTQPGLSGRFLISSLPTIYHVREGLFRQYNGPRKHTDLINFVEEQKWKKIEPVSRFWAPDSFQMTLLANLFKVSMVLRDFHSTLTDEYGLPYYVSYGFFALCTLIFSAWLGMCIVFVADFFSPKRPQVPLTNEKKTLIEQDSKKRIREQPKEGDNEEVKDEDEDDDDKGSESEKE